MVDRGARAVLMRPAPVSGLRGTRSPFLPEFDPFWARVQETGVLVALHASDSGYQDYLNTWEGSDGAEYVAFRPKTFAAVADGGRSIQDTLASAVCHGMLTRFPGVRLMSVENGGSWVGLLIKNLELAYKKMPNEFPEHPLDVFHRNVWVNPFWEDSVTGLVDLIGADRVCFGSDYPHPEGLDDPLAWRHELDGVPARRRREDHVDEHVRPDGDRSPRPAGRLSPTMPETTPDEADGDGTADWHDRVVKRSLRTATQRSIDRGISLVQAAARLLERSNGDRFTVQEVADEAGQSLRTLYQYFESKDDLLLAVFEESMQTYARMIGDAIVDLVRSPRAAGRRARSPRSACPSSATPASTGGWPGCASSSARSGPSSSPGPSGPSRWSCATSWPTPPAPAPSAPTTPRPRPTWSWR